MLTLNKLEKVMELEEQLRGQYQSQLDEQAAQIESLTAKQTELNETIEAKQAIIDKQLTTITELTSQSSDNQRLEQQNRELGNRADNLQSEVTELKKRIKTMQKDLAEERAELKTLKQYDPARMKKNLDANKKKLAEKTKAADALQKSLNQSKAENAESQRKVKELEAQLEELQADLEPSEEEAA